MKDKVLASQLAEEEKTEKKKPEVIPNPNLFKGSLNWADDVVAQEAAEAQEAADAQLAAEAQEAAEASEGEVFEEPME